MNIALRRATGDDVAWLESWLPSALGDAGFTNDLTDSERRIIERDGERAGVVALRVDARRRRAVLLAVATAPGQARRGSGMRSAALVEEELRARGVRRILAPAPEAHGISVYFWIRLGYRPARRGSWPCDTPGIAWFERAMQVTRTGAGAPGRRAGCRARPCPP